MFFVGNNCLMIKTAKNIKLIKEFKMEYATKMVFPSLIKDSDISAMFCGLLSIVRQQAKQKLNIANREQTCAYQELLRMYLHTLKEMNNYKYLYLKEKAKSVK